MGTVKKMWTLAFIIMVGCQPMQPSLAEKSTESGGDLLSTKVTLAQIEALRALGSADKKTAPISASLLATLGKDSTVIVNNVSGGAVESEGETIFCPIPAEYDNAEVDTADIEAEDKWRQRQE